MGFKNSIESVLKREGLYSNHPQDRGGATKYGITLATLSIYRKGPVTEEMVKNLSLSEALDIYEKLYWSPLLLDQVKDEALAAIILDQAINRGGTSVVRRLQRILGVTIDGIMGPKTLAAINMADSTEMALKFVLDSQMQYAEICVRDPSQLVFLKGWLKRTHELLEVALSS